MTDLNPFALFWAWTDPVSSPAGHQAAITLTEERRSAGEAEAPSRNLTPLPPSLSEEA